MMENQSMQEMIDEEIQKAVSGAWTALKIETYMQEYPIWYDHTYAEEIQNGNDHEAAHELAHEAAQEMATDCATTFANDMLPELTDDIADEIYEKYEKYEASAA